MVSESPHKVEETADITPENRSSTGTDVDVQVGREPRSITNTVESRCVPASFGYSYGFPPGHASHILSNVDATANGYPTIVRYVNVGRAEQLVYLRYNKLYTNITNSQFRANPIVKYISIYITLHLLICAN